MELMNRDSLKSRTERNLVQLSLMGRYGTSARMDILTTTKNVECIACTNLVKGIKIGLKLRLLGRLEKRFEEARKIKRAHPNQVLAWLVELKESWNYQNICRRH